MTRGTTEFTQQNSERAMQATNLGMNWALELAEQSLNQSKGVLDGLFNVTRKMTEEFDNQTSAIREHSTSLIEKTLSNTFDFGHKLARLSGPQELVELQSEFVSRQSQAIADQTKELGQKLKNGTTGAAARPSRAA
ncbi:MAG: phasin family protein [Pseudolabrys sp.]